MKSRISHSILALILGLFCLFLLFQTVILPVSADDWTVLNTNDSGAGSLRQAISDAGNGDTILFDSSLNGQTITLTSGQLLVTKILTISGPGVDLLAISGDHTSRVFLISATVTISGVTIKEGFATDESGIGGGIINRGTTLLINSIVTDNTSPACGGGIGNYGSGSLTLTNSIVFSNTGYGCAGGINNGGTVNLINSIVVSNTSPSASAGGIVNSGTVNLINSTVSGNSANSGGGGITNTKSGTVNLINSTVSGNTAFNGAGGGILNEEGTLNLINSTVSGNSANFFGGGGVYNDYGAVNLTSSTVFSNMSGGIRNNGGTTTLTNTILANNSDVPTPRDCINLSGGIVTSNGYNLVQAPNNCIFSATGDITNTNPLLSPLADNGGDTLTHALLNDSPAIDHIPIGINGCGTTITTDQRGVIRPQEVLCDIGAYEDDLVALQISKTGVGHGLVSSIPEGIHCGLGCMTIFPSGTVVTLTAVAEPTSLFAGWFGDCSGSGNCVVTMDFTKNVTATFAAANPLYLPMIIKP